MDTTTNTSTALSAKLLYDGALLTAKEKAVIVENWDGEAQLIDDVKSLHVGTHDGWFHADEALALAMLRILSGAEVTWVRTRDPKVLDTVDLRVDVGEGLLDHHGPRAKDGVAACSRVFTLLRNSRTQPKEVWEALAPVVEATAATDTGVQGSVNIHPWVQAACAASRVHGADNDGIVFGSVVDRMTAFVADLVDAAQAAAKAKALAETILSENSTSEVIVFPAEAMFADVKKMMWTRGHSCVYYVFPESASDWRVSCAASPDKEYSPFSSRRPIPQRFRGLRGTGLDLAVGGDFVGGIFCHAAGFVAGFRTKEAATRFARLCLTD